MKMYVEDFITAIPLAMEDAVLSTFNVYNASLQFTIELEINGKLPFLDILLVRKLSCQHHQQVDTENKT